MKKLMMLLLVFPLLSTAQKMVPRFEKDTLFTTSGFKIYIGQTLQFGKGTGRNGKFRYVNIKSETSGKALTNNSIVVNQMRNFGVSTLGNGYIEISGSIIFKDGSKGYIIMHMAFDRAIQGNGSGPGELIAPEEFRNASQVKGSVADEIEKLNKLYKEGVLTKEEFEAQKKKLLGQ